MLRKGIPAVALAVMLVPATASAQRGIELTPFGGYQVGGKLRVREGDLRIADNPGFGATLNVPVKSGGLVELLYARQETELQLKDATTLLTSTLFDMSVEYFQLGGVYEAARSQRVKGYGVVTLGATLYNPQEDGRSSEWRFSGSLGVGAKSFFSPRVGIRAESRLLLTFISSGGSIWCSGGGCLTSVSGTAVAQVMFNGGLILAF